MQRLDVYQIPFRGKPGFVVDVQANLLRDLKSRVIIPLIPVTGSYQGLADLNPIFSIDGVEYLLLTQEIAPVSVKELGQPKHSLDVHHDQITKALDMLLHGF